MSPGIQIKVKVTDSGIDPPIAINPDDDDESDSNL